MLDPVQRDDATDHSILLDTYAYLEALRERVRSISYPGEKL